MARHIYDDPTDSTDGSCDHRFGAESTHSMGGAIIHESTCSRCRAVRKRGVDGADHFGRIRHWETIETREEYAVGMGHHLPHLGREYFT